jgi:hypothetical protein
MQRIHYGTTELDDLTRSVHVCGWAYAPGLVATVIWIFYDPRINP